MFEFHTSILSTKKFVFFSIEIRMYLITRHLCISSDSSSSCYPFLRSLRVGKSRQFNIPLKLNFCVLNHHFSDSASIDGPIKSANLNYVPSNCLHSSFSLKECIDCDVKKSVDVYGKTLLNKT